MNLQASYSIALYLVTLGATSPYPKIVELLRDYSSSLWKNTNFTPSFFRRMQSPSAPPRINFTEGVHSEVWMEDWRDTGGQVNESGKGEGAGMGSNGVTVTKFLHLLMILELYLELSYFFSQILLVVTVTEVTKVPKFLTWK